jgi:hypothetical protein
MALVNGCAFVSHARSERTVDQMSGEHAGDDMARHNASGKNTLENKYVYGAGVTPNSSDHESRMICALVPLYAAKKRAASRVCQMRLVQGDSKCHQEPRLERNHDNTAYCTSTMNVLCLSPIR